MQKAAQDGLRRAAAPRRAAACSPLRTVPILHLATLCKLAREGKLSLGDAEMADLFTSLVVSLQVVYYSNYYYLC